MKKYFLLICTLCMITACNQKTGKARQDNAAEQDSTSLSDEGLRSLYTDWKVIDQKDYTIRYPKDWMRKTDVEGSEFFIYSPQTDADDQFRENISLVTENLKGTGYDLDQYVKAALKMLRENIIESKRIQRAGRDCQMVVYTQNFPEKFTTKNELYIWVKNGKAYMLAFSYVIADDNPAQSAGREILRTFILK
ncbi:hypothetical protein TFUB4_00780 [Tannerella forsythia]|uniref:hypothetical protein n=1 Tax=Tannerella forsythia TaxID=28112 RepID=UPI00086EC12A|nr:hypothetical protein [Tannerella forsythia]SCQ19353.1 hypothetical protein TFUB4_00780 [Tannerella forsythia]